MDPTIPCLHKGHPRFNLRIVDGVLYNSLQEAAIKAGIFYDTSEAETCLLEAIALAILHTIFVFCSAK